MRGLAPLLPVMTGVSQISTGDEHTCALKSGGVYCWGDNSEGQLGNGLASGRASILSPPSSPVLTGVAAVTTGWWHTCALMTGGDIMCWGDNEYGELGNGKVTSYPSGSVLAAVLICTVSGLILLLICVYCWKRRVRRRQAGRGAVTESPHKVHVYPNTDPALPAVTGGDAASLLVPEPRTSTNQLEVVEIVNVCYPNPVHEPLCFPVWSVFVMWSYVCTLCRLRR